MEPHTNLRLLLISLCLVISLNSAKSRLPPDLSLTPQPVSSPSPSPSPPGALDFATQIGDFWVITESLLEPEPLEDFGIDITASQRAVSVNPGVKTSVSVNPNPEVKKICDQTDHSSLCLATVLPLIKGKPTVDSVLQVAVQAGSAYAKQALSQAKKLVKKRGTPEDLLSTLKDCKDSYDTAVDNFQKTLDAFATNDVGTMRSMLSAVITFVGDCQDQFEEMQVNSPLTGYAEKLTEMASNCLAISSLKN